MAAPGALSVPLSAAPGVPRGPGLLSVGDVVVAGHDEDADSPRSPYPSARPAGSHALRRGSGPQDRELLLDALVGGYVARVGHVAADQEEVGPGGGDFVAHGSEDCAAVLHERRPAGGSVLRRARLLCEVQVRDNGEAHRREIGGEGSARGPLAGTGDQEENGGERQGCEWS